MNYILPFLLLITSLAYGSEVNWTFVKVVDGDTISFINPALPKELEKVSIRLYGIDTPESTYLAKCDKEKQLGLEAKEYVKSLVKDQKLKVIVKEWDKYGGRVLGDIYIKDQSLKDILISKGYARPYDGGKKSNWCVIENNTRDKKNG